MMEWIRKNKLVFTILVILLVVPVAYGIITSKLIPSSGVMADVDFGVYWDIGFTDPVTVVDWGITYVNEPTTVQFYIVNVGNIPHTLYITTANWTVSQCFDFTSTADGVILQPDESILANFTLTPLQGAADVDDYAFDIIITADDS